ncbi:hypothetical protein B0I35DRAFT_167128 [Stachybotrys elegans]|uniref:Uncharacterized protein n=1 Tax=Stachybotrys elegans TaxID=80388 RepID=A0A8K0SXE4_9HYPO|nr:hypothetical protein B0I35DRAFT_167128 [Stachybotrys elegans]
MAPVSPSSWPWFPFPAVSLALVSTLYCHTGNLLASHTPAPYLVIIIITLLPLPPIHNYPPPRPPSPRRLCTKHPSPTTPQSLPPSQHVPCPVTSAAMIYPVDRLVQNILSRPLHHASRLALPALRYG